MGYFKTLTIDPSAAREYSQRWAQSDQVEEHQRSHLVSSRGGFNPTAATTVSQLVNLVRPTQNDQVRVHDYSHLAISHRSINAPTAATTIAQPVNITREHVGKALRIMRYNAQHNAPVLNALNRAALNVEACPWTFNTDGELVITSATNDRTRYHVTATTCDCKAARSGRPCWHRHAYELLHAADAWRRLYDSQEPAQRAAWREAQQAVDELF